MVEDKTDPVTEGTKDLPFSYEQIAGFIGAEPHDIDMDDPNSIEAANIAGTDSSAVKSVGIAANTGGRGSQQDYVTFMRSDNGKGVFTAADADGIGSSLSSERAAKFIAQKFVEITDEAGELGYTDTELQERLNELRDNDFRDSIEAAQRGIQKQIKKLQELGFGEPDFVGITSRTGFDIDSYNRLVYTNKVYSEILDCIREKGNTSSGIKHWQEQFVEFNSAENITDEVKSDERKRVLALKRIEYLKLWENILSTTFKGIRLENYAGDKRKLSILSRGDVLGFHFNQSEKILSRIGDNHGFDQYFYERSRQMAEDNDSLFDVVDVDDYIQQIRKNTQDGHVDDEFDAESTQKITQNDIDQALSGLDGEDDSKVSENNSDDHGDAPKHNLQKDDKLTSFYHTDIFLFVDEIMGLEVSGREEAFHLLIEHVIPNTSKKFTLQRINASRKLFQHFYNVIFGEGESLTKKDILTSHEKLYFLARMMDPDMTSGITYSYSPGLDPSGNKRTMESRVIDKEDIVILASDGIDLIPESRVKEIIDEEIALDNEEKELLKMQAQIIMEAQDDFKKFYNEVLPGMTDFGLSGNQIGIIRTYYNTFKEEYDYEDFLLKHKMPDNLARNLAERIKTEGPEFLHKRERVKALFKNLSIKLRNDEFSLDDVIDDVIESSQYPKLSQKISERLVSEVLSYQMGRYQDNISVLTVQSA